MNDQIIHFALEGYTAAPPSFLEQLAWLATVALAFITGGAAWLAKGQLQSIRTSREDTLQIARATFLLELDRRWDSPEMTDARTMFVSKRDAVKASTSVAAPLASDDEKQRMVSEAFKSELANMRKDTAADYLKIMRMVAFFETAGLMVDRKYIPADEIILLFKGPITEINVCFRAHIEQRQKEMGVPTGLYEHALNLASRLEKAR